MKWFGTTNTLHVVSEKIYEIQAKTPDGDYVVLELWPNESLFVYAMHRPGDDALCIVKVLEDGTLDRYLIPVSFTTLYLRDFERTLFVGPCNNQNEEARLRVVDNMEQAMWFSIMLDAMKLCATDERRVM